MYSKFVDHMAIAFDFYKKSDSQSASTAIKAAFESPDAAKSIGMLLRRNNIAFRAAAQDIGLEFEVPGDDLRVIPEDKVTANDDGDEDDLVSEEPSSEVKASMQRLMSSKRKATAAAKPAPKTSTLKDRYFASLRAK